ncbi:MAG: MFS transporter [Alicyclobacillus macrosporangiidus]|uniref:MFS transporter n=1 Tax=Alicyclobacillus macrosporangiidus TaxID=392015 RepID=UPI0026EBBD28|nr:MFS transporter [Alicyclobacillus macrosporangiidus]MCL6600721.1 MFS transporter [Alicyclobacillus macrosporangiidus]
MLLITTLAILLTSIDRQILPTVLPAIMKDFHLDSVQAGWLNSLNFIGSFVGAIIFGAIADALGKGYRRATSWMITALLTVISGIATFFTKSIGALQFWRVIMGIGTGAMEPVNVALVSEFWQKEDRGFAVGVHHTGFPFGQFLGPVLMGAILAVADWRATFLWIPAIGIVIIVLQYIIGTRRNQERVYQWIEDHHLTLPVDKDDKERSTNPLTHVKVALSNRNVLLSIIMIFLFLWAEQGVATFMTLHLTSRVGLPLAVAAVISGASGITGWIGQVFWGTVSDHMGRKFSLGIIAVGWTLSVLACIFINSATLAWIILIGWGLFRNSPYPVTYALLIDSVPEAAGSGMGLMIGIALGLSGFLVAPVSGYFIQHFGWTWDYIMLAFACILTFIPMAFIRETNKRTA